ncbi:SDR family NAD(P)-dependent oxidoreductase [Kitasatospora sp. NPDC052896]|uniref:type I polyketide synthase n=1 Tax=Kitasatospora sp. NPDC052896 TaxID=3364061 RepID=UPI0037C57E0E
MSNSLPDWSEPIAIVGVGLRFPGDNDTLEGFGEFLAAGRSGTGPIPEDRWDVAALFSADPADRGSVRTAGGGFLRDLARFDARFFNISPKEAQFVDPQQRLVLECAWSALEHANIDPAALRNGDGGVYVGVSCLDYVLELGGLALDELDAAIGTGTAHSAVSGRLSYFLGLTGPSISVDTACSSSLVALHMAAEGLRRGECSIALCGGVSAIHQPFSHIVLSNANMLAPDGRCKTFAEAADGYARSEGCGMMVLKRLSDARRDGDRILAVVRGSAIRQDGASGGLAVPSGTSQAAVMTAALERAGLGPSEVRYVEAHGTGTALGDPIEMGAINAVFGAARSHHDPLRVASVKTNIGHMEAAAGMGGIMKTLLQLREGAFYPHLNLDTPSPHIPWHAYPVTVPQTAAPWPDEIRRAVVNSFGFAGTVASVVLEQAPEPQRATPEDAAPDGAHVLTVSAKTDGALRALLHDYRRHVEAHPELSVRDLCYTANVGRTAHDLRTAAAVRSREELLQVLAREAGAQPTTGTRPGRIGRTAFVFAGQGVPYAGAGAALHEAFPVFRRHLDECDRLFSQELGFSVRELLLTPGRDEAADRRTLRAQPALFSYEYALARLWLDLGVRPSVMIGHSLGELSAAAVAEVLPLPDAVRLVATRARIMQSVDAAGGMTAVMAPAEKVAEFLTDAPRVAIAAVNSPHQCVVSGAADELAGVVEALRADGVVTRDLGVSHAFHSPLMAAAAEEFRAAIAGFTFREPVFTLVSTVTAEVADPAELASPDYWARQLCAPVDFAGGLRTIDRRGAHAFLEIGPGETMTALAKRCVPRERHRWLGGPRAADPAGEVLRVPAARAFAAGLTVDWQRFHAGRPGRLVELPGYAFERRHYWVPTSKTAFGGGGGTRIGHPLLGHEVTPTAADPAGVREFAAALGSSRPEYLRDHVVLGQAVFPAAGFVEQFLAVQHAVFGATDRQLSDLVIHEPLFLGPDAVTDVRTRLRTRPDGRVSVEVVSRVGDDFERRHVSAELRVPDQHQDPLRSLARELEEQAAALDPADCTEAGTDQVYAVFAELGLEYGPEFRRLTRVRRAGRTAVAELRGDPRPGPGHLPPGILDSALQATNDGHTYLPLSIGELRLLREPRGEALRTVSRITAVGAGHSTVTADLVLADAHGPVLLVHGLTAKRVEHDRSGGPGLFHEARWVEREPADGPTDGGREVVVVGTAPGAWDELVASAAGRGVTLTRADGPEHAARLLRERPADLCWFWQGTDRPRDAGPDVATLRAECERNYRELLALVQLLAADGTAPAERFWLVTSGARAGTPGTPVPAAATLWGFGTTLRTEYPAYGVTLLDLDPATDPHQVLADEWSAPEADESQIAYRSGRRRVRRILPLQDVPAPAGGAEPAGPVLDPEHLYLITGGLGGLGLATAGKLAAAGARHLVLVGRREVPAEARAALRGLLGEGVTATLVRADIGTAAGVERIMATLRETGRPLGGVIHAAGALADVPIVGMSWEQLDTVFESKVYGSHLLHQALEGATDLRFFVGFSSLSVVIGPVGQANYAAGNAFLDELMVRRVEEGRPGLSINWGPWAEIGMAAALSADRLVALERGGVTPLAPEEGTEALVALLDRAGPTAIVGRCDWDLLAAGRPGREGLYQRVATAGRAPVRRTDLTALKALPPAERLVSITELVRAEVARLLHFERVEEVGTESGFIELGLDSLVAMELKNALESVFQRPMPAAVLFESPSVRGVTEYLAARWDEDSADEPAAAG